MATTHKTNKGLVMSRKVTYFSSSDLLDCANPSTVKYCVSHYIFNLEKLRLYVKKLKYDHGQNLVKDVAVLHNKHDNEIHVSDTHECFFNSTLFRWSI